VSADHDGVVARISVVDVSDGEPVVATGDSDVVLGAVMQIEPVLEPLRPGVRLRHLALERGWLAEAADFDALQRLCEHDWLNCATDIQRTGLFKLAEVEKRLSQIGTSVLSI